MTMQEKSTSARRRSFGEDVNGLVLVLGVLAVLMVALPCPMSAASNSDPAAGHSAHNAASGETAVNEMKR